MNTWTLRVPIITGRLTEVLMLSRCWVSFIDHPELASAEDFILMHVVWHTLRRGAAQFPKSSETLRARVLQEKVLIGSV